MSIADVAARLRDEALRPCADATDAGIEFPHAQWTAIAESGLCGLGVPTAYGGLDVSNAEQAAAFRTLAEGCLTSSFILCQHHVCATLLAAAASAAPRQKWLEKLARGHAIGANGINFLNLPPERAPMKAERTADGFVLRGTLPWTTAAAHSSVLAAGAVLDDTTQLIALVPLSHPRVRVDDPLQLLALTASHTTSVHLDGVEVGPEDVLVGPAPQVLQLRKQRPTAFVATALTVGHARGTLDRLAERVVRRPPFWEPAVASARGEVEALERRLAETSAANDFDAIPALRARANVSAVQVAHLLLMEGGGTGYRAGQTPQRLLREATFFSVWSVAGEVLPNSVRRVTTGLGLEGHSSSIIES